MPEATFRHTESHNEQELDNTCRRNRILADETFISAADLQNYMEKIAMAHAKEVVDAMGQATLAREQLAKTLSEPMS